MVLTNKCNYDITVAVGHKLSQTLIVEIYQQPP